MQSGSFSGVAEYFAHCRDVDSSEIGRPSDLVSQAMRTRTVVGLSTLAMLIAACGAGAADSDDTTTSPPDETTTTSPEPSQPDDSADGLSALDDMRNPAFPEPLVDPDEIISGGPPPDGIPPIEAPQFISVEEADEWLGTEEPVVYVEVNDEVKAYPVQILIWHEIVNDTVGDVPVAVTYCPLCNSAVTYVREVDGEVTSFGTSGRLFASALVMYDRATESLWTHFDGRAVVGVRTGEQLEFIPSPLIGWADFKEAFPDALVLDRDQTGHSRPYGENPYVGYDNPDTNPFLFRGTVDDRAAAKQRVVGVNLDGTARAWTLEAISDGDASATNTDVAGAPIVIFWRAGQATALESELVVSGRDVGSVAVFLPTVDGQDLTFEAREGVFVDDQTQSEWDITGKAVSGELAGTTLEQIHHLDTFWFAWSTYQPETDLIEG